jgi:RNA polymerase-binding transcription factor DksA
MPAKKKAAKPAPKAKPTAKAKSAPPAKKPAPVAKKAAVKKAPAPAPKKAAKPSKPTTPLKKAPAKKAAAPAKKPAAPAKKAAAPARKAAAPARKAAAPAKKAAAPAKKPAAPAKKAPAPAKKPAAPAKKAAAPAKKAAAPAKKAATPSKKAAAPAKKAAAPAKKEAAPAKKAAAPKIEAPVAEKPKTPAPEPKKAAAEPKKTKKSSVPSVSVAGKPTVSAVGGKVAPIPHVKVTKQEDEGGATIDVPRVVKITPFLKKQRQRLIDLRSTLYESMESVAEGSLRQAPEGSEANAFGMHQADAGSDAYDRDFALGLLSKEQDAVYEINAALERLDRGTYGICEQSGKPIPEIRLEALPFTRFTVECQAALERQNMGSRYRRPSRSLFGLDDAADESPEKDDDEEEAPETRKEDSDRADRSDA